MTPPRQQSLVAIAALCLLPFLAVLLQVYLYGGHLPFRDQWDTPGRLFENHVYNNLHWEDFFDQHNEARKAFSSAIWFLLGSDGWDVRTEMYLSVLTVYAGVILYLFICANRLPHSRSAPLVLAATASALLFNPFGFSEGWLWGVNLENALMATLLLGGIGANLFLRSAVPRYLTSAAISLAATYTFANGMILWVLLYPRWFQAARSESQPAGRHGLWLDGLYLVLFVATALAFFHGYARPLHHPSPWESIARPLQAVQFFFAWLGAPLSPRPYAPATATVTGLIAFSVWAYCAALLIRAPAWTRAYPWLALSVYTLISGLAVTLGRSSLGVAGALAPRYLLHVSLFYLGLNGLLWQRLSAVPGQHSRFMAGAVLTVTLLAELTLLAGQWHDVFDRHIRPTYENTARSEAALQFASLIPDNPDLVYLYPLPERAIRRYEILRRYGVLRDDTVPGPFRLETADAPLALGGALSLSYDGERLRVHGTLADSPDLRDLTHLLAHSERDGQEKFFSVVPLRIFARAVEASGRSIDASFATGNLADGLHRIRLFGYDSLQRRLIPTDVTMNLRKAPLPRDGSSGVGAGNLPAEAGGMVAGPLLSGSFCYDAGHHPAALQRRMSWQDCP